MLILLKQGRLIDYVSNMDKVTDILIEDDKIKLINDDISMEVDNVIDCKGLIVIPGLIDMHCHLRDPGFTYKEDIQSGLASAVKGGFTGVCPMPNTKPTIDNASVLLDVIQRANEVNLCKMYPVCAVTKEEKGEELTNFEELKNLGAIFFSDDGIPVSNAKVMKQAILETNRLGTFVSSHCEEISIKEGAINEGEVARKLNVSGVQREAEEIMVAREIVFSATNNARVHICHISTKGSVELIKDAKRRGVPVTCETCTHHFSLTEQEVLIHGTNAKMNPALRTEEDRQAIISGLVDGTIDCIVTDHAPHSEEEKLLDLEKAPNGIIGFETALMCGITYLFNTGKINYLELVKLMSTNPAKLLGLNRGTIQEGEVADITIFNPNEEHVYTKEEIVSKSKNSPFIGKRLKGEVEYTIVEGNIKYKKI